MEGITEIDIAMNNRAFRNRKKGRADPAFLCNLASESAT
jgi:hypothetical protein